MTAGPPSERAVIVQDSSAAESDPRRCFHPAADRVGAFREEGLDWSSVALFCLAHRMASPEDREQRHDAASGRRLRTFHGPGAGLASVPPYPVSFDEERGTAVWDWGSGERLAQDGSFVPVALHPGSHERVSWTEGALRVSRLVE